jgi:hypothetical protein
MKTIFLPLLVLCLELSCRTIPGKMTTNEFEPKGSYLGKVHVSKNEACPIYITIEGVFSKSSIVEFHTIYPVNLANKFKKNGLYLQFNYTPSRAMSPEGCKTDAVVSIENVEKSNAAKGFKFQ